jgi:hypothetical protein
VFDRTSDMLRFLRELRVEEQRQREEERRLREE